MGIKIEYIIFFELHFKIISFLVICPYKSIQLNIIQLNFESYKKHCCVHYCDWGLKMFCLLFNAFLLYFSILDIFG